MGSILREYETIVVLHPDLPDEPTTQLWDRLKDVITRMQGELLSHDSWGKKKLAFAVKKQARGNYSVFHFIGPTGILEEFERVLRNAEHVIRFLSTAIGVVHDVDARRIEVEKKTRERALDRARREAERQEREARLNRTDDLDEVDGQDAAPGDDDRGRDDDRDRDRGRDRERERA